MTMNNDMTVGVLAFHGDFAEHIEVLKSLGVEAMEIRSKYQLERVSGLIIPGGESTVMAKFLESTGLGRMIRKRVRRRTLAVFGTCAGSILLAKKVIGKNAPKPLKLMKMTIERNAYGTQRESFEAGVRVKGITGRVDCSFIRAPMIRKLGRKVEVLAAHNGDPILVRQRNVLAGTFHPEMRGNTSIHQLFLTMVENLSVKS